MRECGAAGGPHPANAQMDRADIEGRRTNVEMSSRLKLRPDKGIPVNAVLD